jgi:hypothetical protein
MLQAATARKELRAAPFPYYTWEAHKQIGILDTYARIGWLRNGRHFHVMEKVVGSN